MEDHQLKCDYCKKVFNAVKQHKAFTWEYNQYGIEQIYCVTCTKKKVKMRKIIIILILFSLTACASKPIIDSRGGSGNIEHNAERQDDDLYTCMAIADDNTNDLIEATKKGYNWLVRPKILWLAPKLTDNKKEIINNCMAGRGHQILLWK